jgi:DNA-binding transcriptional regulator YhcF (GntR family)
MRSASVHAVLRQTALENRNDCLRPFYSIRAVADHFHVPPATVSRIYRRLSSEKLLRMIWGSKTLLEPLESSRKRECRFIGIPVKLDRFVASPDYRASILTLQLEIWNHEVNEHILFFEQRGDHVVHLCTRNHHPRIDTVVWLLPEASHRQTLLRLHDLGFRVICLSDQVISGVPDCYAISSRCTVRTIVRKTILKI